MTSTLSRIQYNTNPEEACRSCDLVVEAIVENMAVKQELFSKLDKACQRWKKIFLHSLLVAVE